MSRVKPTIEKVANQDEANEALRQIAICELHLKRIDADTAEKISKEKEKAEKAGEKFREKINQLSNALAVYGQYNKSELFSKQKSIKLTFGTIGFRLSTKISVKKTTLELLKKLGWSEAVSIKEGVDKTELKKWPDEKLAQVDARRKEDDTFYFETDTDNINEDMLKVS